MHVNDAYVTGSAGDLALRVALVYNYSGSLVNAQDAGKYLPIRLTDGNNFYNAGGSQTASVGTVAQGAPSTLSSAWPVKISDGNVVLGIQSSPFYISQLTASQLLATIASGSLAGLLYGGVPASSVNPFWITGSVSVTNGSAGGGGFQNVTASISGQVNVQGNVTASVNGTLSVQGLPFVTASISNFPAVQTVTGSLSLSQGVGVTGQVNVQGNVTASVNGTVSVTGLPFVTASISNFPVTQVISASNWIPTVTGSVTLTSGVGILGQVNVQGNLTSSVNGTVSVAGLPFVTASVSNFPATQVVSASNWIPTVTGSVLATVTGSVIVANQVNVSITNFPATQNVVDQSGSVVGLLYGGVTAGQTNPFWVTGSVAILNPGAAASSVTALSGSVIGLLLGGQPVSTTNPIPISGSISVTPPAVQNVTGSSWTPTITGSVSLTQGVGITGQVNVQGNVTASINGAIASGSVTGLLIGGQPASSANPLPVSVATSTVVSGSVIGLLYGGVAASQANPIFVSGTIGFTQGVAVTSLAGQVNVQGNVTASVNGAVSVSNFPATQVVSGSAWTPNVRVVGTGTWVEPLLVPPSGGELAVPVRQVGFLTVSASIPAGVAVNSVAGQVNVQGNLTASVNGAVSVSNFPATQTLASGSVTGLLYGGVAASTANPIWVTGSIGLTNSTSNIIASGSVTGLLAGGVAVSNANPVPVVDQSGSVIGLLVGGLAASLGNPVPVTGSAGILIGGVQASLANPVPMTGAVGILVGGVQAGPTNPMFVSSSAPIYIRDLYGNVATFGTSTSGTITPAALTVGSSSSLISLFHVAANIKRVELQRISVSWGGGVSGCYQLRGNFITADGVGGTTLTPVGFDRGDASSMTGSNVVRQAPAVAFANRIASDILSWTVYAGGQDRFVWEPSMGGKPIVLRANTAEGFELRTVCATAVTGAVQFSVDVHWTEA